ncbi:MAG TPA: helix-turn-helix transcriptional regulator, partial [Nocardioides sp.]|nr:helix-turn-helix transcriptional regulator [Nocardioides sp.]
GPAWSRVHLGAGRWVTLRAERMTGAVDLAVTIEVSTVAERREVFALAHGLSPREREVLGQLATGADSRTIARALALSEHTVNDHVRAGAPVADRRPLSFLKDDGSGQRLQPGLVEGGEPAIPTGDQLGR